MKKISTILWIALSISAVTAHAALADDSQQAIESKHRIMMATLEQFWGKANDYKGAPILPANDEERHTLPIKEDVGRWALDIGMRSGMAQWCGLEWQNNYDALMRQTREHYNDDKQIAFVSVLHGVGQNMLLSQQQGKSCSPDIQHQVQAIIAKGVVWRGN